MTNLKSFNLISFAAFAISLAFAIPTYIESSFLEQYLQLDKIGLFVASLMALNIVAMLFYPKLIRKLKNDKTLILIVALAVIPLLLMPFANNLAALLFFALIIISLNLSYINLDVALENISTDNFTGRLRTQYLTYMNIAWVSGPIICGYLVSLLKDFRLVYFVSGIIILATLLILAKNKFLLSGQKPPEPKKITGAWQKLKNNPNLGKAMGLNFILNIFYCLMVLYVPIHLNQNMGFSWPQIGIMITTAQLPYLFFAIPAGKLADGFWGEKEIMSAGLLMMIFSLLMMFLLAQPSIILWTVILLFGRAGSALTEAMTETFFFKNVSAGDVNIINLYRAVNPGGWLIGGAVSALTLKYFDLPAVFIVLTIILFFGLCLSFSLKDSK